MPELFYTPRLNAAYMAREFGVKYTSSSGDLLELNINLYGDYIFGIDGIEHQEEKIYITPDSYSIFEPQIGDVTECYPVMDCKPSFISKITNETQLQQLKEPMAFDGFKIIQRNNQPFFMPEAETEHP